MHVELPLWPPRRRRRQTDMLWLERLEDVGLAPFQDAFPDSPPALLNKAVDQFNSGLLWECHETLEDLWLVTPYPLRHFYQGVLKIAVGLHHSNRHKCKRLQEQASRGTAVAEGIHAVVSRAGHRGPCCRNGSMVADGESRPASGLDSPGFRA